MDEGGIDIRLFIVDSGTTSSRVRLWDGDRIADSARREAGARDVAIQGDSRVVAVAIRECIEELLERHGLELAEIDAIVASGMISSPTGLLEIPHRPAPAGLDDIASELVVRSFPDISSLPIHFIPGVKTGFGSDGRESLADMDMMRGEEAEIFGYLAEQEPGRQENDILFMHYGSHHKCILLRQGRIEECRTSVTGELMMAVSQHTLLRSSLLHPGEVTPDMEWVRKGLEMAESYGFGRALFSVRVADTMARCGQARATSFFLGALLSLDFSLLKDMVTADTRHLVLYGRALFPSLFEPLVQERYPELAVACVSEEESDRLSALGALRIFTQFQVQ